MTHNLWATLNQKLYDYLNSVTLQDLVNEQIANDGKVAMLIDRRPAAAHKVVSLPA
jgi:Rrf2 family iron-sulfur cluster assembly transcriptional regulator